MSATVILFGTRERIKSHAWIDAAPPLSRITFNGPKRTIPQNALLHHRIGEIAEQVKWHGMKLSVADWKLLLLDALGGELRMVPNIAGNGFVNLGRSTAQLSKDNMSQMIDLVQAFGADHGVIFSSPEDKG